MDEAEEKEFEGVADVEEQSDEDEECDTEQSSWQNNFLDNFDNIFAVTKPNYLVIT